MINSAPTGGLLFLSTRDSECGSDLTPKNLYRGLSCGTKFGKEMQRNDRKSHTHLGPAASWETV